MAARAIDVHPQKQQIIDALLEGRPYGEILSWCNPPLCSKTLQRYKTGPLRDAIRRAEEKRRKKRERHLARLGASTLDPAKAQDRGAVTKTLNERGTDPFFERLLERQYRRERLMRVAEEVGVSTGDVRGYALLDACEHRDLRLQAELAGVLQSPGPSGASVQMLVLLPGGREPERGEVIDIEPA